MAKKTAFRSFRVEPEFPLTSEEVVYFLRHCVDYFTMGITGRSALETYLKTVEGKRISGLFSKLVNFVTEPT